MTENDRNDILVDSCAAMLENACKMVAMTKEPQTNVMQVVYVDSDGGTKIPEQNIKIGELAVYPMTPTKENYKFAHWCIDEERTVVFDFSTPITENITLYDVFIQTTNTVSFDSNGGSEIESQKVSIGGFAEKPESPERAGFDFVCWCV